VTKYAASCHRCEDLVVINNSLTENADNAPCALVPVSQLVTASKQLLKQLSEFLSCLSVC
jgi:hypothetical protein